MTRRALDLLARVAAVIALVVLGVRPTRRVTARAEDLILATPGVDAARLRHLAHSSGARVVRIPGDVPDAAAFARRHPDRRAVTVAGWGLDESGLAALAGTPLLPGPSSPVPGVTHLSWATALRLGDPLTVEGGAPPGTRVRLSGPGGPADSGVAARDGRFRLADTPRAPGRHLYLLEAGDAQAETLGVHVTAPVPPRTVIVAAAPSFEARALRDWLGRAGGVVALRTAVSRERWHAEFVNRRETPLVPLTAALLAQFDVVVTDPRTLGGLPASERATLERAVRETGLGLVVIGTGDGGGGRDAPDPSPVPPPPSLTSAFVTTPVPDLGMRLVRPALTGVRPRTAVPAEPAALEDRFAVETVVRDGAGVAIVQAAPRGAGTVVLSLVDETSRWLRAGEPAAYAALWSRVLRRAARPEHAWAATGTAHRTHQPVTLAGPAGEAFVTVSAPSGARDTVYVAPDPLDPARAIGSYWPREAGWHDVAGASFHVRGDDAWAGVEASARLAATGRAVARSPRVSDVPAEPREERRSVPIAWAFALFVLATGYLWASGRSAAG